MKQQDLATASGYWPLFRSIRLCARSARARSGSIRPARPFRSRPTPTTSCATGRSPIPIPRRPRPARSGAAGRDAKNIASTRSWPPVAGSLPSRTRPAGDRRVPVIRIGPMSCISALDQAPTADRSRSMDLTTRLYGASPEEPADRVGLAAQRRDRQRCRRLEDTARAPSCLPSIFEEQILAERSGARAQTETGGERLRRSTNILSARPRLGFGTERYLDSSAGPRRRSPFPVIASLNGISRERMESTTPAA